MGDRDLLMKSRRMAEKMDFDGASETLASLLGVDDFPPWSFSVDRVCSSLGVATVSESEVLRALKEKGRSAMRTPFEKGGLKTSADYAEVVEAVRASAKRRHLTGGTRRRGDYPLRGPSQK